MPKDNFARWTENREVPSLGTNDGAASIAFQSWHHFKEAFAPELVAKAVAASTIPVHACLDPFGGSGTTALACQMMGIDSATVEVNPFLADVIRAKLARYSTDELASALAEVRQQARLTPVSPDQYFHQLPRTFVEPGLRRRWIFSRGVSGRLAAILNAIDEVRSSEVARLFRVVLGGMLVDVSNVVVSGKGRRYREKWQALRIEPETVERIFAERCEAAILDVQRFSQRPIVNARVIKGDARTANITGSFDLSVFSPPYPNSFDYTDVYNLQLWMLGYLTTAEDNRTLRSSTFTSHVQLLRKYAPAPKGSETLNTVLNQLRNARHTLWNPWIPDMVGGYFNDLSKVVGATLGRLSPGGQCWMVIGDSRYAGITIPVSTILSELAASRDWNLLEASPIRHMKSSAQQGWKAELAETLFILEAKP